MTCIIFARHPDNKGDIQQQHVTFVHVTIGHFLHSVTKDKNSSFILHKSASHNQNTSNLLSDNIKLFDIVKEK